MTLLAFVFALIAGAAITVQAGSNSQLRESLGTPIGALVVNYVTGVSTILLCALFARVHVPGWEKIAAAPWWAWTGGVLGIAFGLAVVFLGHRMGAATLIATVVTGQLVCSVLVDHFAWIGFEVHRAGALRITGCGLMIAGLTLIAKF
jgi:transporter family-2 protein